METRRWTNPSQPQTLQIAVFLLYFNAFFMVIYGGLFHPLGLLLVVASVAGGFGIANEQKWGYIVGLVAAAVDVFLTLGGNIINLMFAIALVALLLHPQSRDYQRIWFR